jgi:hypothetical protein
MRRISTICIAAMLLVATASMSPSQLNGQATSNTLQEPPTLGELFNAAQATGALTPLEHVKLKKRAAGPIRSGGFLQPRVQMVEFYFEGGTSPVVFKAVQPLQFVVRLMNPVDQYGRELTKEEVSRHFALMQLVVQNVKNHDERFLTKTTIKLDVEALGALQLGLDRGHPDRTAQSFVLTPQVPLAPGEYHIWVVGTHDYELVGNALVGEEHWAFEIVAR